MLNRCLSLSLVAVVLSLLVILPGCGNQSGSSSTDATLEAANREWIATYDAYTQTVEEATGVFRSITDDASAEAAIPRLEALQRKRVGEQNGWDEVDLQGMLASDELVAEWDAAYERFHTALDELRAEQGRVWNAASDRSPMMRALEVFPLG